MKTYNQFLSEAYSEKEAAKIAPGMAPEKRRAALEKNARNQSRRDTPSAPKNPLNPRKQKALPTSSVVSTGNQRTKKEVIGRPRVSGPGTRPNAGKLALRNSSAITKHKHKSSVDDKQVGSRPGTTRGQSVPSTTTTTTDKEDKTAAVPKTKKNKYKDFAKPNKKKNKGSLLGSVGSKVKAALQKDDQRGEESGGSSVKGLTYKGGGFD